MAKEQELSVQVYDLVQRMKQSWEPVTFFKDLLRIYGTAEHSVNQAVLNDRAVNIASEQVDDTMERADLAIRQRAYFRFLKRDEDVAPAVEKVKELKELQNQKYRLQFIICCSAKSLCLYDLVENDSLFIDLDDLPDRYAFLLPIKEGRREKITHSQEADKKACLKLTRLLDTLDKHNGIERAQMQKLNSFIRRILFCFFAEDTGIFNPNIENMFTQAFDKLVDRHGGNAQEFFSNLFTILKTPDDKREQYKHQLPAEIMAFPYVNGGLFKDQGFIPKFDLTTRNQFIDCGRLAWHEISPAIFGAMFQGAMKKDERRNLGAHYTSEENILKIIKPLFLDRLYAEFDRLKKQAELYVKKIQSIPSLENEKKSFNYKGQKLGDEFRYWRDEAIEYELKRRQMFKDFLKQIGRMKFLDPACGCGNFLLIAYRELRKLENEVLSHINEGAFTDSYISINQFYGIEIEDWPAEIAHVSMWLMQHLMNQETNARFGSNIESIPLKSSATIVTDNALTKDWNSVLPASECSYILGNPPFGGTTFTTSEQKKWLQGVYPEKYKLGLADYVTAWFVKAADYMQQNKKITASFVATNSICQGEQVNTLWGLLLNKGIKINFAYSSFPWKNDAADKAGVTCVIIGFSYQEQEQPTLIVYDPKQKASEQRICKVISPYLTDCKKPIIIERQRKALSAPINLVFGNKAVDDGNFLFEYTEGQKFLEANPEAKPFVKKFIGSSELMKSEFRYCLWLTEETYDKWSNISLINERVKKVKEFRLKSKKAATIKNAQTPWSFGEIANPSNPDSALVVPAVTSENRVYIPMDFIKSDTIINNRCFILPNASNYDFAILTSRIHMVWMRLTSGRLESRYNYSRDLTFNTFIWPETTEEEKTVITKQAEEIRLIRAMHSELNLGDMYNPNTMPEELLEAHQKLDLLVERAYRPEPFADDDERLAFLLDLYSQAITKDQNNE